MNVSSLIECFLKQNIQSEAEVRSKLIVPLLELLCYPIELRAEEFPVYGYEGGKPLTAKAADFLQFTSNEFAENRENKPSNLEWVYNHSLLVFEAKKPTQKLLVKGQSVFYSAWTKSVAYMISNGVNIEGYIVNANYSDTCVFSCLVSEIPAKWDEINRLNYQNILKIKNSSEYKDTWNKVGIYEPYKNVMRTKCTEELYVSVDRTLEKTLYSPNLRIDTEVQNYTDIIDNTSKIIVSEPGGGKTHLIYMMLRDYLLKYNESDDKIPVVLEGRYFGKLYKSIVEGVLKELGVILPFATKEYVEKRINEGGFIILFDALDEVKHNYDELLYELHQLRRDTSNIIVVTSREQNYKDDLCIDFTKYTLEKLSDEKLQELLKLYSNDMIPFNIHHIPTRLLELIRTPLFFKLFISLVLKSSTYKIPSNHSSLFEMYIDEKIKNMSCSLYEESIIKQTLSKYAVLTYDEEDSTDLFFETLSEFCESGKAEKIYEIIWETGIICKGAQGIKFFHKAIQEFFVALYVSKMTPEDICGWLDKVINQEKYYEIICYLTGIISNQQKQNIVLDYLENYNLKLYIKATKSRRNFTTVEEDLNSEYAEAYFEQILKSYTNIVEKYFYNIKHAFDGYTLLDIGKACIKGTINFVDCSISMIIYNGSEENSQVEATISSGNTPSITISGTGFSSPIFSSVFSSGGIHQRYYNLELLSYGFDSSREIAIDIIKSQVKEALKNKTIFDTEIDVLLVERVENLLKDIRTDNKRLSLYEDDVESIVSYVCDTTNKVKNASLIGTLCSLLINKKTKVEDYLDIREDITTSERCYYVDSVYSDEQLLKKVKRILELVERAVYEITHEYIPILSSVYKNTRTIAIVYRNGKNSGYEYIEITNKDSCLLKPIIEFSLEPIHIFGELNDFYKDKLLKLGKNEKDIISKGSSVIFRFFEKEVFHKLIYEEIDGLFSELFSDK